MMKKVPPLGNTKSAKLAAFFYRQILRDNLTPNIEQRLSRLEGIVLNLYRTNEQYGLYNKILYRKYKKEYMRTRGKGNKKRALKRVPR